MSGETCTPKVLVLDDDVRGCEAVCLALNDAGFAAFGANDIDAALNAIASAPPSIIVTDLQMPGSEDADIVRRLRGRFPKLPIIAMSGNHDLGASALELGANAFLPKPLARGAVAERVGALIQAAA
jgi:DNA-binding response OmpR family regulator